MKQLLQGNVLHMLPIPRGVVAAVLEDVTEDGKMVVEYRMIFIDTGEVQRVANSIYMLSKFGAGHKGIELQIENNLMSRAAIGSNGEVFVIEGNGESKLLDSDGYFKWKGSLQFNNESPCDCVFDNEKLWLSYTKNNTVVRYNTETMKQELRIGDINSTQSFNGPCGIYYNSNNLYICNRNSNSVWQVNTTTYNSEMIYEFAEPIYGFARVMDSDIIHLESGIYIVD